MMDINRICEGKKSIALGTHIRPDGDAFGSSLGLYSYLKKTFPEARIDLYMIDPNPLFSFLPGFDELKTEPSDEAYDLFIALDMGDKERLGKAKVLLENALETACIDHHLGYKGIAPEANSYVVEDASSTAELVYDLIGADAVDDSDRA